MYPLHVASQDRRFPYRTDYSPYHQICTVLGLYTYITGTAAHQIDIGEIGTLSDGTALPTKGAELQVEGAGLVEEEEVVVVVVVQVVEKASFRISLTISRRVWKRTKRYKRV